MRPACSSAQPQRTVTALTAGSCVAVAPCSSSATLCCSTKSRHIHTHLHRQRFTRFLRRLRQFGRTRNESEWTPGAAAHDEQSATATWTLRVATASRQRLAVVPVSAAFVGGGAVAISGALASFGRLLLSSPATKTFVRSLIRAARPLLSGPFSVIVVAVAVLGAAVAAVRSRIMASVRACKECRGYGIERCPLCGGMGLVGWEGKWDHEEPCPMCLARRYVNCRSCGGLYHRSIFVHVRSKAQKLLEIEVPAPKNIPSEYFARLTGD